MRPENPMAQCPPITVIAFDLGNVLIRVDHGRFCRRLGDAAGMSAQEVYAAVFDSGLEPAYDTGRLSSREFYQAVCRLFHIHPPFPRFCRWWQDIFDPMEGMDAVVEDLARRYPLFLLSNTNALHFPYIYRTSTGASPWCAGCGASSSPIGRAAASPSPPSTRRYSGRWPARRRSACSSTTRPLLWRPPGPAVWRPGSFQPRRISPRVSGSRESYRTGFRFSVKILKSVSNEFVAFECRLGMRPRLMAGSGLVSVFGRSRAGAKNRGNDINFHTENRKPKTENRP
jgi:hypothetical protein